MKSIAQSVIRENLLLFPKVNKTPKIFTVKSLISGDHITFNVKQSKDDKVFFVGLLSVLRNDSLYKKNRTYKNILTFTKDSYSGNYKIISKNIDTVTTNNRYQTEEEKKAELDKIKRQEISVKTFEYVLFYVFNRNIDVSKHAQFYHDGYCIKCGKHLSDPESIEIGTGPTCGGRINPFPKRRMQKPEPEITICVTEEKRTNYRMFLEE